MLTITRVEKGCDNLTFTAHGGQLHHCQEHRDTQINGMSVASAILGKRFHISQDVVVAGVETQSVFWSNNAPDEVAIIFTIKEA